MEHDTWPINVLTICLSRSLVQSCKQRVIPLGCFISKQGAVTSGSGHGIGTNGEEVLKVEDLTFIDVDGNDSADKSLCRLRRSLRRMLDRGYLSNNDLASASRLSGIRSVWCLRVSRHC